MLPPAIPAPQMAEIWSPRHALNRIWFEIEALAAEAMGELWHHPEGGARIIREKAGPAPRRSARPRWRGSTRSSASRGMT